MGKVLSSMVWVAAMGCSVYAPYDKLPPTPPRPHPYFQLDSVDVPVSVAGLADPIRIHCKVAGEGRPLLLIHGLMTSSYSYRYVIPLLAPHYRVIVPDLPGAGRSDAPPDLSVSPESVSEVLAGLIEALKLETPYVIGNSMGGYQALWLAVVHPEKVRRLVILHAPGFPQFKLEALHLLLAMPGGESLVQAIARKNPEGFAAASVHYHDPAIMSQEEAREYGAIFHDEAKTRLFTRILRETMSSAGMTRLRERLKKGPKLPPLRLLWAREDVMVPPSFGPRYQELLPGAELVWFDGSSHFLQVDAPEKTVEEILRFDR